MNKENVLEKLHKEIRGCDKCPLCENVTNYVPGEGPSDADLMFIGEAPGKYEDESGRPFVGKAGELLTKFLEKASIDREDVFITSVLKCRPPNNRNPQREEIKSCKPYLERQIEIIEPSVIIPMGNFALKTLLNKNSITKHRGKVFRKDGVRYIPTYHPAAAVYNANLENTIVKNFKKIKERTLMDYL
ncbi:MAG: uracil-DNA glycosylase family protein [Candidatus Aenigmatarchaeota archaeon]